VSRGQALVEFAFFVPLLMFMVIGATDVSTLLDDHLNVVYAARAGARVGSVIGSYAPAGAPYTADCAIIGAVQAALAGSRNVQVTQIAIYDANASGMPQSATLEDIYPGNAVCNADGTISPAATQTGWPPADSSGTPVRSSTPFTEDSIGVAITYTYTYQFNPLGGGTFTTTDRAIMPIEIVVGAPTPISTPPLLGTPRA
jgi:Flp pilus assembly protein TadG